MLLCWPLRLLCGGRLCCGLCWLLSLLPHHWLCRRLCRLRPHRLRRLLLCWCLLLCGRLPCRGRLCRRLCLGRTWCWRSGCWLWCRSRGRLRRCCCCCRLLCCLLCCCLLCCCCGLLCRHDGRRCLLCCGRWCCRSGRGRGCGGRGGGRRLVRRGSRLHVGGHVRIFQRLPKKSVFRPQSLVIFKYLVHLHLEYDKGVGDVLSRYLGRHRPHRPQLRLERPRDT
mmetsp:Transcript_7131/g.15815  ORF Transcript_7131/g.15815 Transcript_7131/m.15815 type:complete len:224 (+) Transcript_7131:106-777(+)